jgi:putative membrane protein
VPRGQTLLTEGSDDIPRVMAMDDRPRRLIGVIIGALIILLLGVLLIEVILDPSNFFQDDGSFFFPWRILGLIFALIFIGFVVRIVFWAFLGHTWYSGGFDPNHHRHGRGWEYYGRGAERILDERYARGEITREQYQQMREDIQRGRQGGMGQNPPT